MSHGQWPNTLIAAFVLMGCAHAAGEQPHRPYQLLAFIAPEHALEPGESLRLSFSDAQWTLTLTGEGMRSVRADGFAAEHLFDNISYFEACTITPLSVRLLVICDGGPDGSFLGFVDPNMAGEVENAAWAEHGSLYYFLGQNCVSRRHSPCYARVGDYLLFVVEPGDLPEEYGSALMAVDARQSRIVWPSRTSIVPGVGALQTVPEPRFYRRDDFPGSEFRMTVRPIDFSLANTPAGPLLEVRGVARFACEAISDQADTFEAVARCRSLGEGSRAFEAPVSWSFDPPADVRE